MNPRHLAVILACLVFAAAARAQEKPETPATPAATDHAGIEANRGKIGAAFIQSLRDGFKELGLSDDRLAGINKMIDEHVADVTSYTLSHQQEYAELGRQINEARASGDAAAVKAGMEKVKALNEGSPSIDILFRALGDNLEEAEQQKFKGIMEVKRKELEAKYGKLPEAQGKKRKSTNPLEDAFKPVPASERIDPKKAFADLHLTPEQLQKVGVIMKESREQMQRFQQFHGERLKQVITTLREAIAKQDFTAVQAAQAELEEIKGRGPDDVYDRIMAEVLTSEQKEQFEPVAKKLREQSKRDTMSKMFPAGSEEKK